MEDMTCARVQRGEVCPVLQQAEALGDSNIASAAQVLARTVLAVGCSIERKDTILAVPNGEEPRFHECYHPQATRILSMIHTIQPIVGS